MNTNSGFSVSESKLGHLTFHRFVSPLMFLLIQCIYGLLIYHGCQLSEEKLFSPQSNQIAVPTRRVSARSAAKASIAYSAFCAHKCEIRKHICEMARMRFSVV